VQGTPACYRPDPAGFQPTSPEGEFFFFFFFCSYRLFQYFEECAKAPLPFTRIFVIMAEGHTRPPRQDIAGSNIRTPNRIVRPNPLPRQDIPKNHIAGLRNFKPLHIPRPPNPLPSDAIPVRQVAAACRSGDLDLVIELVAGQNRSAHVLNHGLYAAIQAGHEPVARYLLENGVEMTPLVIEYATKSKSIAIFRLLMDHGWKVNDPTRNGCVLFP
jgi:hypothetical protein